MLAAADNLTGSDIDVREPIPPAPHQHRTAEAGTFNRGAIACGDKRLGQCGATILRLVGSGVWCGQLERSPIPSGPISRKRTAPPLRGGPGDVEMLGCPHDRPAVLDDALGQQQPALRSQGCICVDHEGIRSVRGCLSNFHSTTGALRCYTTSYSMLPQSLNQPAWAAHSGGTVRRLTRTQALSSSGATLLSDRRSQDR